MEAALVPAVLGLGESLAGHLAWYAATCHQESDSQPGTTLQGGSRHPGIYRASLQKSSSSPHLRPSPTKVVFKPAPRNNSDYSFVAASMDDAPFQSARSMDDAPFQSARLVNDHHEPLLFALPESPRSCASSSKASDRESMIDKMEEAIIKKMGGSVRSSSSSTNSVCSDLESLCSRSSGSDSLENSRRSVGSIDEVAVQSTTIPSDLTHDRFLSKARAKVRAAHNAILSSSDLNDLQDDMDELTRDLNELRARISADRERA